MCTVIRFTDSDNNMFYARNFDLDERNYGEKPMIAPIGYEITYKHLPSEKLQHAIIGTGMIINNYPLFIDAFNDQGVGIATLNYPGHGYYPDELDDNKVNLAPYEIMTYILNHCSSVADAKKLLENTLFVNTRFLPSMPVESVHWIISDNTGSITVEQDPDGLHVYDNKLNVLTNSPGFKFQVANLNNYVNLDPHDAKPTSWVDGLEIKSEGVGTGSRGLPGDCSPASRFVRASYLSSHYPTFNTEEENIAKAFNLLGSVAMIRGSIINPDNNPEYTIYSECYSAKTKTYYYKRNDNPYVKEYKLTDENSKGSELYFFE